MLVQIPHNVRAVALAHKLKSPVVAVRTERVKIAVDATVRALPPDERLPDREGPLAEVRRVDALLAKLFFDRLARKFVQRAHVIRP